MWFIIALILAVIAIIAVIVSFFLKPEVKENRRIDRYSPECEEVVVARPRRFARLVAAGTGVVAIVLMLLSSWYTQDAGEAKVQRSITGALVGQTTTAGFHGKAPWVSTRTFDVRNNVVSFVGTGKTDNEGGSANGPQITFQDKEGVTGNLDIVIRYSVNPNSVLEIYKNFQTQENFVSRVITNDIRSVVRNIPAKYGTLDVFNNRAAIGNEIQEALKDRWETDGVVVDEVSLQEIRYSKDVTARFDDAQAARIAVSKAQADQQAAKVQAETKRIEAEGQASANDVLSKSLTPQVLQQRYIDALKAGTVFVVPDGSTPLVSVPSPSPTAMK